MSHNLRICHTCPKRQRPCNGPCACTVDRVDIQRHATAGDCPMGYFTHPEKIPDRPIPLAGDLVAAVTHKFGIDRAAKALARLAGKADCGCARRQERLNRLDARLRKMILRKHP